jgi:hypothetical protein
VFRTKPFLATTNRPSLSACASRSICLSDETPITDLLQTWQEPAHILACESATKSIAILRTGWSVDPKNAKIAALMIQICIGRNLSRTEMETWFERAMALDPNNGDAAFNKLTYISPKWHGTAREFVAFGYECANSQRWGGSVPLVLVAVHQEIQKVSGVEPAIYFGQASVWRDLRASYEKLFRLNPTDTETRPKFARDAFYAGDYKLFLEQIEKAGPIINYYAVFGSEKKFDEMKKKALLAVSI